MDWNNIGSILGGLFGAGGPESMLGQGSGFNPATMVPPPKPAVPAAAGATPELGLDMSVMAPIMEGLMGSLGPGQTPAAPAPNPGGRWGGSIIPTTLPQSNPVSIRNRMG